MTQVFLSLGSNIDRYRHISSGLDALDQLLRNMCISTIYESHSVGFNGSNFLNLVVSGDTGLSLLALSETLKKIEDENGRKRNGPKFSPRTLDIDILLFGDQQGEISGINLPREEILHNAFVLLPLSELFPQGIHPVLKKTYKELWEGFDKASQQLWAVKFVWQDKVISS